MVEGRKEGGRRGKNNQTHQTKFQTQMVLQLTGASRHCRVPCTASEAGELATACEGVAWVTCDCDNCSNVSVCVVDVAVGRWL